MAIFNLTDDNDLVDQINNNEGHMIIDFYSTSCAPCKMLAMVLDEVIVEKPLLKILKVNIDNIQSLSKFNIRSVPTLVILEDDCEIDRKTGAQSKSNLLTWIGKHIKGD